MDMKSQKKIRLWQWQKTALPFCETALRFCEMALPFYETALPFSGSPDEVIYKGSLTN